MRSFVWSGERKLEVPGVFKLKSSIRGWLASSVLMDAARFLVMGPRGDSGGARFGSLDLVAMVGWLAVAVSLEGGRSLREEVVSTWVIMGLWKRKRGVRRKSAGARWDSVLRFPVCLVCKEQSGEQNVDQGERGGGRLCWI